MSIALLFILLASQQPAQQPARRAPPPPTPPGALAQPVARVDVQPAEFALQVGDTLRLRATAYDSAGHQMTEAAIRWFTSGTPRLSPNPAESKNATTSAFPSTKCALR